MANFQGSGSLLVTSLTGSEFIDLNGGGPVETRTTTQAIANLGTGAGVTFTDGTHTVSGSSKLTITGATVGGTSPNATLTIAGTASTVKVSLTSAEILAVHGTPIQLVAAPGSGFITQVLQVIGVLTFGTTAYSGSCGVFYGSDTSLDLAGGKLSTLIALTSSGVSASSAANAETGVTVANTAINFSAASNPTTGDGTVVLYVTYLTLTA